MIYVLLTIIIIGIGYLIKYLRASEKEWLEHFEDVFGSDQPTFTIYQEVSFLRQKLNRVNNVVDELKDQIQGVNAVKEIQNGYKLTINDTRLNNSEIYYYPKCKFLVENYQITAVNHKGDVIGSHSLDNRTYDLTKIGAND